MRTLPIFLAFFLMGLADAMGPMSDAVEKQYHISKVMSTLQQRSARSIDHTEIGR